MTIHKIRNEVGDRAGALAAARYLLEPSDGPLAYRREGEGPGLGHWGGTVWLGDEAALRWLGLEGGSKVELEDLTAAIQGRHAETAKQVRKPGPSPALGEDGSPLLDADGEPVKAQVVNSFDLTFSVPKSVSVLWSQADPKLRAEIERAITDAANTAMEHIVRTRPVISGQEVGHGFAAAASLHIAARVADGDPAPAPQLHLHMALVGVLNEAGRLRTPDSSALYKDSAMREMGALARVALARRLEQMGIEVRARTGEGGRYFELADVPKGLCERFSGRTKDVLAWVEEMQDRFGVALTKRGAAKGAAATRKAKEKPSLAATYRWWDRSAEEFEFRVRAIVEKRSKFVPDHDLDAVREEVRAAILERLWKEGPTVSRGALQAMVLEFGSQRLAPSEASDLLAEMKAAGDLVMLADGLVTSGEIRRSEALVAEAATAAVDRGRAPVSSEAVARGIEAAEASLKNELDPEQREAVAVLTSGADWTGLVGRPGTGKGPVLEAVAEAHRRDGWDVVAVALDGATATRLGKQVKGKGISFLSLKTRLERNPQRFDEKTLILIDEASKAGLKEWRTVAEACRERGLRVVMVGDVKQSGAIECAGMMDYLLERVPTAELTVVRRHRDPKDPSKTHPWMAPASQPEARRDGAEPELGYHDALYEANGERAIEVLQENDALTMHDTRAEAIGGLVAKWDERRAEHGLEARETVLVVYGTNQDVDRVNTLAQKVRLDKGEIGGESVQAVDRGYRLYEGDVVMLRETAFEPDGKGKGQGRIENGTMGTVAKVDAKRGRVTVAFDTNSDEPRKVTMDLRALRAEWEAQEAKKERGEAHELVPSLRLGIAGHQFPLQGGTWWYAGSLWGRGQTLEDTISGDARPKFILDVHASWEDLGTEGTKEERLQRKAADLSRIHHKLASLTHEEAPEASFERVFADIVRAYDLPGAPIAEQERGRDPRHWRDPLRHHHRLLGPERVARLEARAEALATVVSGFGEERLVAALASADEAYATLDPQAAYELQRLELQIARLHPRADEALSLAEEFEAEAAETRSRRERREWERLATSRRHEFESFDKRLAKLRDRDRALRAKGRHLDAWLEAEADTLALGSAAARELADREALERLLDEEAARTGTDARRDQQLDQEQDRAAAPEGPEPESPDPGIDLG